VFLPWLCRSFAADLDNRPGIEDADIGGGPNRQAAGLDAEDARRVGGDPGQRRRPAAASFPAPISGVSGSSSSRPVAPLSASSKGICLPSSSTGVWSEHSALIAPEASPRAGRRDRRWCASGGSRRACALKKPMSFRTGAGGGRHVAGHRDAGGTRGDDHLDPAAEEMRVTCTRAPVSRASCSMVARAMVSAATGMPARPSRAATSPSWATPSGEEGILRLQPDREIERWPRTSWRAAAPGYRPWRGWPGRRRRSRPRPARPFRSAPCLPVARSARRPDAHGQTRAGARDGSAFPPGPVRPAPGRCPAGRPGW
jgi:hypothetical protein